MTPQTTTSTMGPEGDMELAPLEEHEQPRAQALFAKILSDMVSASELKENRCFRLGAISFPNHFNDTSQDTVREALQTLEPAFIDIMQVRPSYYLSLLTYPSSGCLDIYGDLSSLDKEDMDYVLLIEKEAGFIQARLAEMKQWSPAVEKVIDARADGSFDPDVFKSLVGTLESQIRAVILAGDIPTSKARHLRQAIVMQLPGLADKSKASQPLSEPSYVNAVGAACVANGLTRLPEYLERLYRPDPVIPRRRDEL